jgi:hypothetical protein
MLLLCVHQIPSLQTVTEIIVHYLFEIFCRRREELRNIRLLRPVELGIVAFSSATLQGQAAFGGDFMPQAKKILKYPDDVSPFNCRT